MNYEMNELFELMFDQGSSDLHIQVNQLPTLCICGGMVLRQIPNNLFSPIDRGYPDKIKDLISLDTHLMGLYNRDFISAEEALNKFQKSQSMHDKLIKNGADLAA